METDSRSTAHRAVGADPKLRKECFEFAFQIISAFKSAREQSALVSDFRKARSSIVSQISVLQKRSALFPGWNVRTQKIPGKLGFLLCVKSIVVRGWRRV